MKLTPHSHRSYKYYDILVAAFVTVLLCSNLIGAGKVAQLQLPILGNVIFGAGILFFPISYAFGDIMTEVYGYAHDRRAVWCGFGALIFAGVMSQVVLSLPIAAGDYNMHLDEGLHTVFGNTWRIMLASITAFWAGSLTNAYVLAKMKVWSSGKYLWMRVIGSTAIGEFVDSAIFYVVAFYGVWSTQQVVDVASTNYLLKTSWEILAVPLTYRIVRFLKDKEKEDFFDRKTDFNPFTVKVE